MARRDTIALFAVVAACQAVLPPAAPAPRGHGLQRIWIETLGLE